MTALSAFAVLIIVPALSVLYREFVFGGGYWESLRLTAGVITVAAAIWLLVGVVIPSVTTSPLYLPAGGLAVLAAFLGTLPLRSGAVGLSAVLVSSAVWTALVFVPIALVVFFPGAIGLDVAGAPLDLGGVLPVHVAAGSAALVSLLLARRNAAMPPSQARPSAVLLAACGVFLWAAWAFLLVGLELAISDATTRILANVGIAPVLAMVGWLIVQRILVRANSIQGAVAGIVCGLVAITPGSPYLDPLWAGVTGIFTGMGCAAFTTSRVRVSNRAAWFLVGAHLLAAIVGLVLLGIFGNGRGFVFTGQIAGLQAQLVAAVFAAVIAGVVAAVLVQALAFARKRSLSEVR